MERKKQIIESKFPPSNKEVIWLDSNTDELKKNRNGKWISISSSSSSSTDPSDPIIPTDKIFSLKDLYNSYVRYISHCLIFDNVEQDIDEYTPGTLYNYNHFIEIGKFYNYVKEGTPAIYLSITKEGLDEVKYNNIATNNDDGDEYSLQSFTYTNPTELENLFEDSDSILVKLVPNLTSDFDEKNYTSKIVCEGYFTFKGIPFSISLDVAYNFQEWPDKFPIKNYRDYINYDIADDFKPLNLTIKYI